MMRCVYCVITTLILSFNVTKAAAVIDAKPEKSDEATSKTVLSADVAYDAGFFKDRLEARKHHTAALNCITEQYSAPAQILDIGSGIGFHTHALTKHGYHVTAVDPGNIKEPSVLWGKTNGFYDGAMLFETTLQELPNSLHGTFDAAFAYMFLIDNASYTSFFKALYLLLKDDAYVMLWVSSKEIKSIIYARVRQINEAGFSIQMISPYPSYQVTLIELLKIK